MWKLFNYQFLPAWLSTHYHRAFGDLLSIHDERSGHEFVLLMLLVTYARGNGGKVCHPINNQTLKTDFWTHMLHPKQNTDKPNQKVVASFGLVCFWPFLTPLSWALRSLGDRTALHDVVKAENIFTEPRTCSKPREEVMGTNLIYRKEHRAIFVQEVSESFFKFQHWNIMRRLYQIRGIWVTLYFPYCLPVSELYAKKRWVSQSLASLPY